MVELAYVDGFPVDEVVARLAVGAQTSLVEVLVAGNAGSQQAQIRPIQVLVLDGRPFLRSDVRGIVALVAFQSGMLAFEHISSFLMVKRLGIPLDQREILPIMFRVAAGTFLARAWGKVVCGVQALVGFQAAGDLSVALQALKSGLATKFVTTGAIGGPIQRLMRSR